MICILLIVCISVYLLRYCVRIFHRRIRDQISDAKKQDPYYTENLCDSIRCLSHLGRLQMATFVVLCSSQTYPSLALHTAAFFAREPNELSLGAPKGLQDTVHMKRCIFDSWKSRKSNLVNSLSGSQSLGLFRY